MKINDYRINLIAGLIPSDVESALDIGCGEAKLKPFFARYIGIDLHNADITQDLNQNPKINLPAKSFDLVILSQILEHMADPSKLITEAKRISKKYVLVGLPNEYTIDNRIRLLFNKRPTGFERFGHKYWFNIQTAEKFVNDFFGEKIENSCFIFAVKGGRLLPDRVRRFLANALPNLFAKEVYFLFKNK